MLRESWKSLAVGGLADGGWGQDEMRDKPRKRVCW
jgi:hypothetical protein